MILFYLKATHDADRSRWCNTSIDPARGAVLQGIFFYQRQLLGGVPLGTWVKDGFLTTDKKPLDEDRAALDKDKSGALSLGAHTILHDVSIYNFCKIGTITRPKNTQITENSIYYKHGYFVNDVMFCSWSLTWPPVGNPTASVLWKLAKLSKEHLLYTLCSVIGWHSAFGMHTSVKHMSIINFHRIIAIFWKYWSNSL